MFQMEYQNQDKGMSLGLFISEKKSDQHNVSNLITPNVAYTSDDDLKLRTLNLYYKKEQQNFNYGFEFSYLSGDSGLKLAGDTVEVQGFGFAAELDYAMPAKSMDLGLKFGYASGDDKSTDEKIEGYIFNRNYDVGMLLMNHPLGCLLYTSDAADE